MEGHCLTNFVLNSVIEASLSIKAILYKIAQANLTVKLQITYCLQFISHSTQTWKFFFSKSQYHVIRYIMSTISETENLISKCKDTGIIFESTIWIYYQI